MNDRAKYLPTYQGCIVCGDPAANPNSLNLRFRSAGDGVEVDFTPGTVHEGYKGIVHGGVLCAVLDETIGWAATVARRKYLMTGELAVRFLRPLATGTPVIVRGRATGHEARYSLAEGEVVDRLGNVYARAAGKFFVIPDEKAREVHDYLTFREGDVDFLDD